MSCHARLHMIHLQGGRTDWLSLKECKIGNGIGPVACHPNVKWPSHTYSALNIWDVVALISQLPCALESKHLLARSTYLLSIDTWTSSRPDAALKPIRKPINKVFVSTSRQWVAAGEWSETEMLGLCCKSHGSWPYVTLYLLYMDNDSAGEMKTEQLLELSWIHHCIPAVYLIFAEYFQLVQHFTNNVRGLSPLIRRPLYFCHKINREPYLQGGYVQFLVHTCKPIFGCLLRNICSQ